MQGAPSPLPVNCSQVTVPVCFGLWIGDLGCVESPSVLAVLLLFMHSDTEHFCQIAKRRSVKAATYTNKDAVNYYERSAKRGAKFFLI